MPSSLRKLSWQSGVIDYQDGTEEWWSWLKISHHPFVVITNSNTWEMFSGWTLDMPSGPSSLCGSTSMSPTIQGPRIPRQPPSQESMFHPYHPLSFNPYWPWADIHRQSRCVYHRSCGGTFSVMGGNLPNLTHMPAYFSRKITLAKQNMLAIRSYWLSSLHWRSGATDKRFPFVVITNHRNLKNLRDVQWLNPRHAQWALFFLQFNFHVT